MDKTITIKGIRIGQGKPKIIVPIVETNMSDIISTATEISSKDVHMVEWRADFLDEDQMPLLLEILSNIREILKEKILLFTFRTMNEGGLKDITIEEYRNILISVANERKADVIDVEVFTIGDEAKWLINEIQDKGCYVVGSNHDFEKTPSEDELLKRLRTIQDAGADIPKIAVMPTSKGDLLTLLSATWKMYSRYANRPIITMSMAGIGMLSRITGEIFGSSMTFGTIGATSAPGQLPINVLQNSLSIIHEVNSTNS